MMVMTIGMYLSTSKMDLFKHYAGERGPKGGDGECIGLMIKAHCNLPGWLPMSEGQGPVPDGRGYLPSHLAGVMAK